MSYRSFDMNNLPQSCASWKLSGYLVCLSMLAHPFFFFLSPDCPRCHMFVLYCSIVKINFISNMPVSFYMQLCFFFFFWLDGNDFSYTAVTSSLCGAI